VKTVHENTLADFHIGTAEEREKLPPTVRIFGLGPPLLEARVGFDIGICRSGTSGLGGGKEELIATQIAALSGCRF
jgi:hypothetical protein